MLIAMAGEGSVGSGSESRGPITVVLEPDSKATHEGEEVIKPRRCT